MQQLERQWQHAQEHATLSNNVVKLYHNHADTQKRPSLEEYSTILHSQLDHFSKVFVIVDALDECSKNNGTRDDLLSSLQKLQPNLHFLVTSRPDVTNIEKAFSGIVRVEILASDEDVKRYLRGRIEGEDKFKGLVNGDLELRDTITDTIIANAGGMSVHPVPYLQRY